MSTTEQGAGPSTAPGEAGSEAKKPVVVLCIGMAGSVSGTYNEREGMTNSCRARQR